MKYLSPGQVSEANLTDYIFLTSIRSEGIEAGLKLHLVDGHIIETAACIAGIKPANLKRALDTLEPVVAAVERIKERDWQRWQYESKTVTTVK